MKDKLVDIENQNEKLHLALYPLYLSLGRDLNPRLALMDLQIDAVLGVFQRGLPDQESIEVRL